MIKRREVGRTEEQMGDGRTEEQQNSLSHRAGPLESGK